MQRGMGVAIMDRRAGITSDERIAVSQTVACRTTPAAMCGTARTWITMGDPIRSLAWFRFNTETPCMGSRYPVNLRLQANPRSPDGYVGYLRRPSLAITSR
jgi:hypothetical protein